MKLRVTLICVLLCLPALSQTMLPPMALPSAQINAAPAYADRARLMFAWDAPADPTVTGYQLRWGAATNSYPNLVSTTKTNAVVSVPEGGKYWAVVRSVDAAGNVSLDSNVVSAEAWFWGDVTQYVWQYRTRGKLGATNLIQEAVSPTGPWTTIKTFIGTGTLTNALSTNSTQKFFRTVLR